MPNKELSVPEQAVYYYDCTMQLSRENSELKHQVRDLNKENETLRGWMEEIANKFPEVRELLDRLRVWSDVSHLVLDQE